MADDSYCDGFDCLQEPVASWCQLFWFGSLFQSDLGEYQDSSALFLFSPYIKTFVALIYGVRASAVAPQHYRSYNARRSKAGLQPVLDKPQFGISACVLFCWALSIKTGSSRASARRPLLELRMASKFRPTSPHTASSMPSGTFQKITMLWLLHATLFHIYTRICLRLVLPAGAIRDTKNLADGNSRKTICRQC